MFIRTKQDLENTKIAIKKYENELSGIIAKCCKSAFTKSRKESDFNLEFFSSKEGAHLQLRDRTCDVKSEIRLRNYDFESINYDGGENLIDYFKEQIIKANEMLNILSKI